MNTASLSSALRDLEIGDLRFYSSTTSTNDQAALWAAQGAPDVSLVIADEQTAGRGRSGKEWRTAHGSGLAISVIFQGSAIADFPMERWSGLGAVSVCQAIQKTIAQSAKIKWPNDVLLANQKVAGILPEAHWQGECLQSIVLGIGVNITRKAVPPADWLDFPATSLEQAGQQEIDRIDFLRALIEAILFWRPRLTSTQFLTAWETQLAYLNQAVQIMISKDSQLSGQVLGLNPNGELRLKTKQGAVQIIHNAASLRPVDKQGK